MSPSKKKLKPSAPGVKKLPLVWINNHTSHCPLSLKHQRCYTSAHQKEAYVIIFHYHSSCREVGIPHRVIINHFLPIIMREVHWVELLYIWIAQWTICLGKQDNFGAGNILIGQKVRDVLSKTKKMSAHCIIPLRGVLSVVAAFAHTLTDETNGPNL